MVARPTGLKLYPGLLSRKEVAEIIAHADRMPASSESRVLFTYYGDFGKLETEEAAPWMLEWGERMVERGIFSKLPNQYRLCDWFGELSDQFKWHIDNKRHGDEILAIALSDKRSVGFRPKSRARDVYRIDLDAGDAYMIRGTCRWQWQHRVMPVGQGKSGGRSFVLAFKRSRK